MTVYMPCQDGIKPIRNILNANDVFSPGEGIIGWTDAGALHRLMKTEKSEFGLRLMPARGFEATSE